MSILISSRHGSYIYIYIRGGTVHVFVPNRHSTGISVRCMMAYDEYRQFTPIQKGAPTAMQRCLITASRRTANANSDTEAAALMFGSLYFILIKYQLAVKLAMLELMCVCARVCARRSLQLFPYTRDGRYLIVCDIPVKILPTIRISLPAIITIKSSCWHISVCDSAERHRRRQTWNWGGVYRLMMSSSSFYNL